MAMLQRYVSGEVDMMLIELTIAIDYRQLCRNIKNQLRVIPNQQAHKMTPTMLYSQEQSDYEHSSSIVPKSSTH
jgi:hypothetical protein